MTHRKRVLIIGSSGFTGKHLADFLFRRPSVELHRANHASPKTPDSRFHVSDVSKAALAAKLIEKIKPSEIYHLVGSYTNDYDTDYVSNVATAKNILDAVRALGAETKILLVGSSAEYGFPVDADKAVREDHPLRPVSIYGLMKLMETALMGTYVRLYDMNIVAVRPFNLFGDGISTRLFAGKMEQEIARYKRGEIKKIVTGDLSVERDFIDIREAVRYYAAVMEKGKAGEVYNVGSGKSTPLKNILTRMLASEDLSFDIVEEGIHSVLGKIAVPKIFADTKKIKAL
jgi:GDP-4-dehydro-6-deoxy-D-mannose reductase